MPRGLHSLSGLAWVGLIALLAGCSGKSNPQPTDKPEGSLPPQPVMNFTGPHAAGKKVLATKGCLRCHNVTGEKELAGFGGPRAGGFRGPGMPPGAGSPGSPPGVGRPPFGPGGPGPGRRRKRGPDLAKVAKDPTHTVDWLMQYIRKPKSKKPEAKMPAFGENKISDADLRALAEYLVSLK